MDDAVGLEAIRRMKTNGFHVLAHEQGSHSWPLGMQCRALLAGAACLLDSGDADFRSVLRHQLLNILLAEARRHAEEGQLKCAMKDLGIAGDSAALISMIRQVTKMGPLSNLPVLIMGESGTGKELIGRAIHRLDPRRCKSPYVAVNCGAISPNLAESELFGHKRGAFTGADRDRKGLIRAAEGGVLFLDEIGELSVELQAKLLRVLQEDRVLGVGEDQEVPVDFRVIAATNRDLEGMVKDGRFRDDLFHRLNVLSIQVCPLRERPDDVKPLVEHILGKCRREMPSSVSAVDRDFIEALKQSRLPGNARQVENLVRRALVNKPDDTPLGLSDLSPEIWRDLHLHSMEQIDQREPCQTGPDLTASNPPTPVRALDSYLLALLESNHWTLARALAHCERSLIEAALHHAHGNQSQAAHLLGITPRSVYNKLRKHDIVH